jgi:hypothetical protein
MGYRRKRRQQRNSHRACSVFSAPNYKDLAQRRREGNSSFPSAVSAPLRETAPSTIRNPKSAIRSMSSIDNLNMTSCPFVSPTESLERAAHIAGAVRLDDVAPTGIRWLWPGRIPLGRVTLLVSDPGLGKSLTLDIAARVSRGAPWPDQCSRHTPCAVTQTDARQGDKEQGRQGENESTPQLSLSPCLSVSPSCGCPPLPGSPALRLPLLRFSPSPRLPLLRPPPHRRRRPRRHGPSAPRSIRRRFLPHPGHLRRTRPTLRRRPPHVRPQSRPGPAHKSAACAPRMPPRGDRPD